MTSEEQRLHDAMIRRWSDRVMLAALAAMIVFIVIFGALVPSHSQAWILTGAALSLVVFLVAKGAAETLLFHAADQMIARRRNAKNQSD